MKPSRTKKQIQTLNDSEIDSLLGGVINEDLTYSRYEKRTRDLLMILLMLDAGLRVGEVVQLVISDLLWEQSPVESVLVRREIAKNRSERFIPTSDKIKASILSLQKATWKPAEKSKTDFAFSAGLDGKPISVRQVERLVGGYGKKLLKRDITPHMLRHTFATRLMKKTSMRVVQKLLGHASISTTQIYTHPSEEDFKNAIKGL